ncbi:MAG: cell division ATP-binding protein FtsE [Pseudomonadota bacterium]
MVRFEEVALSYGEGPKVLEEVSYAFAPGSFHFLTGASGAGKSSLLRMMYLSLTPTAGRVSLFDQDVASLRRAERAEMRRRIGVVFQDFHLLDHLTAIENVSLPLAINGESDRTTRQDVAELLAWVGLADHLEALPPTLSGGQQQRIAIARAVITRPSILLADEPTGNVDDRIAIRLMYLFEELNKLGTTVIIATHNESLVAQFAHPVLRLASGRLTVERDFLGGTGAVGQMVEVPHGGEVT